jgi:hypothetical protein
MPASIWRCKACSPVCAAAKSPAGSLSSRPRPFAYGTGAQRGQWRALIAILESLLRLHRHRTGNLVRLDEYLYRRSGGMIGSLSQLVRGAAISNSYSTASRSTTPPNAATLHHGHRRRGSRKASTAVSSSLANTDAWDFDWLVIPGSQSSCFGKQQTAIGPGVSAETSRTALLTNRRAVRSTITWLPSVHDGAVKCGLGVRRHSPP